ncbi:hypothetical protein WN944_001462 [Citrus x changshan-huyou]|uniref:Uncharacterized protein n=1 Tax=Citrus x changshan-huyou TaxID=2935761 RepID=A0AAP0QUT8_9ROSI
MPTRLHCSALRLMEEGIVHPVKYNDEGKPTAAEFEYPKIYHNGNFFFGAHVFHFATEKMNVGAMQITVCIVRKAKPQFTMSSAEEIDDHLTNITNHCRALKKTKHFNLLLNVHGNAKQRERAF